MQCNGTDSQESPINNNNLNREIERLIANDTEEKLKGYGFMKRLKKRWQEEFSDKKNYSAKGQRNHASTFKKERKGSRDLQNPPQIIKPNIKEKIKWDNAKKIKLVQLEEQGMNGGIWFIEKTEKSLG